MADTNHFDQYPQAISSEKRLSSDSILDGKRKKSLPVKKLLEIERSNAANRKQSEKIPGSKMKFNCDKCGEKYEASQMLDHLRKCCSLQSDASNFDHLDTLPSKEQRQSPTNLKEECEKEVSIISNSPIKSSLFSPSAVSSSSTSSILGSLERMVESSFKGFKGNSTMSTEANSPSPLKSLEERLEETQTDCQPKKTAPKIMMEETLVDSFHTNSNSPERKFNKNHSFSLQSQDHIRSRRCQSPFQQARSPHSRSQISDPNLNSTTSISSTFGNNVLLQGYHQPLTALRKLVEINRNLGETHVDSNGILSPDAELSRSSPISCTNQEENESAVEFSSISPGCKRSSIVETLNVSTPDSMSSNSTSQSNGSMQEQQSKVSNFTHKLNLM